MPILCPSVRVLTGGLGRCEPCVTPESAFFSSEAPLPIQVRKFQVDHQRRPRRPTPAVTGRSDRSQPRPRRCCWPIPRTSCTSPLSSPCLNVLAGAEGFWLIDGEGRRPLDFHGNNVHSVGVGHPCVVAAVNTPHDGLPLAPRRDTNDLAVAGWSRNCPRSNRVTCTASCSDPPLRLRCAWPSRSPVGDRPLRDSLPFPWASKSNFRNKKTALCGAVWLLKKRRVDRINQKRDPRSTERF